VDLPEPFGPMIAWVSPCFHGQVDAAQDLFQAAFGVDGDVQVADFKSGHRG